jgi:ferredoxin-NADP reductase
MYPATLNVVVDKLTLEASDTLSIELRPADSDSLPAFNAGAHICLDLPNGIVRSYSLVNSSDNVQRYVLGVLHARESRGGSAFIHEQLRVGDHLTITPPRNNFPLDETGDQFVIVAGGIGITAIYSMAQRLVFLGKHVEMLYCCRSREHAAWLRPIQALGIPLTLHFDVEKHGPPDLDAFIAGCGADTRYYCCGPSPMLSAFEQACAKHGYRHAHIERFSAAPVGPEAEAVPGYDVQLSRSGKTIRVEPGTRLLDALVAAGVDAPFNCQQGFCGTCEMAVLDGEIDHRDSVLSEAERMSGKSMMVCVSGCKRGRLVLDC